MGINQEVMETFKNSTFIKEIEPDLLIKNRGQAITTLFKQLEHILSAFVQRTENVCSVKS